jgi:hypothetical protein
MGILIAMSTLAEIAEAVAALSRGEQETLLHHLAMKLRITKNDGTARRRRWPVVPPKVSKAESRRIAARINDEFGRVELESWK